MASKTRRVTMGDIRGVSTGKLLTAAIIGVPVGAVFGFIFAVVWTRFIPAGDLVFIACPLICAIGGFFIGPLTVVKKNMQNSID